MQTRSAFVLGLCLVVSAVIVSWTYYTVRLSNQSITATGSARMQVDSDSVKWRGSFSRPASASQVKQGYAAMRSDAAVVEAFFKDSGIAPKHYDITPVRLEEVYDNNPGAEKRYILRQDFSVRSEDLGSVTEAAKNPDPVLQKGVLFTTYGLEYYYSKLPEARIALLGQAVQDARRRAEEIAGSGGAEVGNLKNARMGVVQVLAPQSRDVSGYGTYDTSTIPKDIMVTVRAEFMIHPQ